MKKLVSIALCLCMIFAIACMTAGCGNDELLNRMDDLQTTLQTQSGKIDELQNQNSQLTEKLGELQTVIEEQAKAIEELEYKTAHGKFYTLKETYDNGWLTQEDIQTIAKYYNNYEITYPESLKEYLADAIKSDWAKKLKDENSYYTENLTKDDIGIVNYCGIYNRCVVVKLRRLDCGQSGQYVPPVSVEIGGITFYFDGTGFDKVVVWKF